MNKTEISRFEFKNQQTALGVEIFDLKKIMYLKHN